MSVPYCIKCNTEMRCIKTGYVLKPADRADDAVFATDLFECVICGSKAHNRLAGPQYRRDGNRNEQDNKKDNS